MSIEEIRKYLRERGLEAVPATGAPTGTLADFMSWSPVNNQPIVFAGGSFPDGISEIIADGHEATTIKFSDAFSACIDISFTGSAVTDLTVPSSIQTILLDSAVTPAPLLCNFPAGLTTLSLSFAQYTAIPALPPALESLDISQCANLTSLPALPATLVTLNAAASGLTAMPALAGTALTQLDAEDCAFTTLPALPASLVILNIVSTGLTTVPTIPAATTDINAASCGWNSAQVDNLLAQLVANGAPNGSVICDGTNGAPTGAGVTSKNTLITRGWTVTTN
ncbi:MAG: hypothetical protein ACXWKG_10765 [Limisphaerales bacterium]